MLQNVHEAANTFILVSFLTASVNAYAGIFFSVYDFAWMKFPYLYKIKQILDTATWRRW